jgi:hypothetical protein
MQALFVKQRLIAFGHRLWTATTRKTLALALLPLLAPVALHAQDAPAGKISLESEFRFSMVGDSQFKDRFKSGGIDGYDLGTRNVFSMKVREGLLFRFGMEFDRLNFSIPDASALPNKLQTTNLVIGADLQLGDAWIFRLEVQPGFYGADTSLRGRNMDVPIILGASYFVSADLQLVAGLSIDPERKYPVFPGIGFRYKCSTDWVLDMILPTPRIEYTFSKSLLFYAGGDVHDGSYRTAGDFGTVHGDPRLNDAVVDYIQIRVGGGASWKIRPDLTLELEAGVVPVQEFDFHRASVKARSTEIPPYGGLVFKAAF